MCFRTIAPAPVRIKAAATRVHGRHQHSSGRILVGSIKARYRYFPLLQGLPQNLDGFPAKFRKLIQKQNSLVSQTDHPRSRPATASRQCRLGNGMVRGLKGRFRNQSFSLQPSGHTVNFRNFQTFLKIQHRQNRGNPLGKHSLSGSRRPDHQYIMPSRRRNFQSTFRHFLSLHLGKIVSLRTRFRLRRFLLSVRQNVPVSV